jgi:hypothetical protein
MERPEPKINYPANGQTIMRSQGEGAILEKMGLKGCSLGHVIKASQVYRP